MKLEFINPKRDEPTRVIYSIRHHCTILSKCTHCGAAMYADKPVKYRVVCDKCSCNMTPVELSALWRRAKDLYPELGR